MLSNKILPLEIIMFNMSSFSEWQKGVVNRNYHIFHKLLNHPRVGRVIGVDFLPFTLKRALRNYWENIIKGPKGEVIWRDLTSRLVKISHKGSAELYIFSTIDSIFSHQKVINKLNKALKKIESKSPDSLNRGFSTKSGQIPYFRVVWSYFPMFVDYFSAQGRSASGGDGIKADLYIFDAVDNWIEHPSFVKYKKLLENNYRIIAEKSDLVFTVAENLIDFFKSLDRRKNTFWVANGVDIKHFVEVRPPQISDILRDIPRPIIGYVGTIQNRIDLDLMEYLAKKNPDKSFVLIGPLWPVFLRQLRRQAIEIKRLKKYKNIYLLGRKSYQIAPAYIKNFDAGIIPHKLDKFIKYTYPLKISEYLACGIPVITTPASGVEKFSKVVYIAENYQDFNKKIDLALKQDKIELREQRIARAKEEDWDIKLEQMMDLITQNQIKE